MPTDITKIKRSNSELPANVRNVLPARGQTMWRRVFNSILRQAGRETPATIGRAAAGAWTALRRAGWRRGRGGMYTLRKAEGDAPNYRESNMGRLCSNCSYGRDGYCDLYDFDYMDRYVCDSHRFPNEMEGNMTTVRRAYLDKKTNPVFTHEKGEHARIMPEKFAVDASVYKVGGDDQRLVYVWASVVTKNGTAVIDSQGDVIELCEIQGAAHDFMMNAREGKVMHKGDKVSDVVESMVFTEDLQKALGVDLGKEGWLIAFKVHDDDVWKDVKAGNLPMASIGGSGYRQEVEDDG